ncbi:MAG: hypothetical protein WBQ63_06425, partial [Candidatus Acidiferrales bacterium]
MYPELFVLEERGFLLRANATEVHLVLETTRPESLLRRISKDVFPTLACGEPTFHEGRWWVRFLAT